MLQIALSVCIRNQENLKNSWKNLKRALVNYLYLVENNKDISVIKVYSWSKLEGLKLFFRSEKSSHNICLDIIILLAEIMTTEIKRLLL